MTRKKKGLVVAYLALVLIVTAFKIREYVKQTIIPQDVITFSVTPDGKRILYSNKRGELRLYDFSTGSSTTLPFAAGFTPRHFPMVSPDGKMIAFSADSDLWTASIDGTNPTRLIEDDRFSEFSPSFSPDGKTLVFARPENNPGSPSGMVWIHYDVWSIRTDGTKLTRLTEKQYGRVTGPQFTPDGRTILFAADDWTIHCEALFALDVATRHIRRVCPHDVPQDVNSQVNPVEGHYLRDPALSADGSRLVFCSDYAEPFHPDIYLSIGKNTIPHALGLTRKSRDNGIDYDMPRFSRDGQQIFYLAGNDLWKVDARGTNPHFVTSLEE